MNTSVACPKCGRDMKIRHRKSDGKPFWGCPDFPKCNGIVDYNEDNKGKINSRDVRPDTAQSIIDMARGLTPKKATFIPSSYQKAIFEWVQGSGKALVVRALAGCGKTTTGIKMLDFVDRNKDIVYLAFNKHIAEELKTKVAPHVRVQTYHALGYTAVRQAFGNPKIDEDKVRRIIEMYLDKYNYRHLFSAIEHLVSLVKGNLTGTTPDELQYLAERYNIELNGDAAIIFQVVPQVVAQSLNMTSVIDFDDMCYFPVALNLPIKQYDFLFVDECLPYKTPVLLSDGSSLDIGDIVTKEMSVTVLSYDEVNKTQVPCKVIGWHKILNHKELVKVKVQWSINRSGNSPTFSFVTCTTDHKIFTSEGYIEAGKLRLGMTVQVETAAKKSDNYKITTIGRNKLSGLMIEKNSTVITRSYRTPKGIWKGSKGGNGTGMTEPQKILLSELGEGWISEYAIGTKNVGSRKAGYPTCYKADLANPERRIAVEIDGASHNSEKDSKKDACLAELGWTVFRFKNLEVMQNLSRVLNIINPDCPIDATVVSIEPTKIKDWYVYDIEVEKCHNFYANSILVHNCQDTNKCQIALALMSLKDDGRIVAVGDEYQSIYGFRGADVDAIPNLIEHLNAETLPLSVTYRCPKSHVEQIHQLFPEIPLESAESARDGVIKSISNSDFLLEVRPTDMILCRTNAPLVTPAFELIRKGVKAIIRGRDIGSGLTVLIRKMKANSIEELLLKLKDHTDREVTRLKSIEKENQALAMQDKYDTIVALCEGTLSISELEDKIETIFSDSIEGVVFSSVHKAKGLEAERVYILKKELMPHKMAKLPWEMQQERNIQYVAYTRSLSELIFVS